MHLAFSRKGWVVQPGLVSSQLTVRHLKPSPSVYGKIIIACTDRTYVIAWEEIMRCESVDNYCRIHRRDGQIVFVSKTLKAIEQLLPADRFYRIHRSHTVRLDAIASLSHSLLTLTNGDQLPIARDRYKLLMEKLKYSN